MGSYDNIPHRPKEGMCPVNGIRDLIQWRTGLDWSNEFLWGLGQGGGFAYLRFNAATPPRQMFTGNATPRQHRYLAELFGAGFNETENRAFKSSWGKAKQALVQGTPPILGPLDMFHLPHYPGLYHQRHIPIHFVLLVGCEGDQAYILDTGLEPVQAIGLPELQQAWDVAVPGLGKRNRLAVIDIPEVLPPTREIIRKSITDQCQTMLQPPVSMLGIPAMKKLAEEIVRWPEELGAETAAQCLRQVREYLNSPPDPESTHLTAGRDRYVAFLQEASPLAGMDFSAPIRWLNETVAAVPALANCIDRRDLAGAAAGFRQIAAFETQAYQELSKLVRQ